MRIPIIDTGHGFDTPGKRSLFHFNESGQPLLKENSFNEAIGNKLSMIFYLNNKEVHFITNEWWDVSLDERCNRENELVTRLVNENKKSIFISIHADAFGNTKSEGEKASGATFFYKSKKGKQIAEHFTEVFSNSDYPIKMRQPKYANFKVLRSTHSPAILFEAGFMTNSKDLEQLLKDDVRNLAAKTLYTAITSLDI